MSVCLIVVFLAVTHVLSSNAKIGVITRTSGGFIYSGETYYYKVTMLGNIKSKNFDGNANEYTVESKDGFRTSYSYNDSGFNLLEDRNILNEKDELYSYVNSIINILNKNKSDYQLWRLFVTNNRYFVTVLDNSPRMSYYDILYEYNVKENTLKEIARFKGEEISEIYVKD